MAGAVRHVPPAAQFRRALSPPAVGSPTSPGAAWRPGEVSAPGFAVLLGRARGGCPLALAVAFQPCCCPRSSSVRQHTGAAASRPTTLATRSRSLLQKEKRPGSPGRPVAAVARAIPEGSRGWFPWRRTAGRPCLPGRTPASPHLCRLSPCAVGFVQNPSSECPTIRLQGETKHYGVRGRSILAIAASFHHRGISGCIYHRHIRCGESAA
jgi:hypothetical protein